MLQRVVLMRKEGTSSSPEKKLIKWRFSKSHAQEYCFKTETQFQLSSQGKVKNYKPGIMAVATL